MFYILNPVENTRAFIRLFIEISRYKELLWEMTKRELCERHSGQMLGGAWAFIQPLLVMLVYTFVFSFIFNLRVEGGDEGFQYVAYLLSGLVPWLAVQDALSKAPNCIVGNKSLIKQIVFPSSILPLTTALPILIILVIGLSFPILIMLFSEKGGSLFWVFLPIPIVSQMMLVMGLTYILAALAVFVKDLNNIVQILLMIGFFVHPILYVPGMLPDWVETAFYISPFSHVVWLYRDVLITGSLEHGISWFVAPLLSLLFLVFGYRLFNSMKHMFGDLL